MDQAELYSFLRSHRYGVLASTAEDGTPQAALVGIAVTPALEVIFDTLKHTRKYPNLVARPKCSFVIGWSEEQTVQLQGSAFSPVGDVLETYLETYFLTWPECRGHLSWPGIAYFVVRLCWIRLSDYAQNPPRIEEIELGREPADTLRG